jgi:putative phosphoribosyl transferase
MQWARLCVPTQQLSLSCLFRVEEMMFRNRNDAGQRLAQDLQEFRGRSDTVVVGLARGGVVIAYEVALALNLPLDVVVVRKIGAPHNEEVALGAVTEDGKPLFNEDMVKGLRVSDAYIKATVERERRLAAYRSDMYRQHRSHIPLQDKIVIACDDGIATGATMKVALLHIKAQGARKVIAAAPVGAADSVRNMAKFCDQVVCHYIPSFFGAVGAFYQSFSQTDDSEVIEFIRKQQQRVPSLSEKEKQLPEIEKRSEPFPSSIGV